MDSFKQSKRDLQMIETTQSYLKLSKKYLEWLLTTLNTLYGEKLRYPEHYSDEKKTRQLHRFQQMMKVTNESLFYLNQNHKSFENRIEEDKKQYEVEHKTVQEHRRVKAGQEAHKQEEIEREERQRLAREKELEDKARYHQELATKLQLEIANEKKLKELQANKKGSKRRKEYEENENGQLATLNFGKHADDNEQEQDGDFSLRVSYPKAELPERRAAAPKKKSARTNGNGQAGTANDEPAGRGEGRSRLKKQKAPANKDDSDELLEVDDDSDSDDKHDALPPLDDDDEEPRAKPKRKPKADNDSDIEPDQLNFGGRDEGENEF